MPQLVEKNPKLTIITINLNNIVGLKSTINSVLNQTWKEFEFIIIDGNSTDGSVSYIDSVKENITHFICEKDKGIYNAMNKGLKLSSGNYILYLNSGDCLNSEDSLESLNWNEIESFDIISSDLNLTTNNQIIKVRIAPDQLNYRLFYYSSLPHPSTLVKRSILIKHNGFKENYKIISDWIFFLSAFRKGCTYKKIEGILSKFDLSGTSSVNNKFIRTERIHYSLTHLELGLFFELIKHIKWRLINLVKKS